MRSLARLYPGDRVLLALALTVLAVGWAMALLWAPSDRVQGDLQRLMYVHVPAAWATLGLFTVAFGASVRVLWRRSTAADHLALACIEVGVLFAALTVALGALWGRPVWGVWWTWDPRLTSTVLMLALFVGVLAIRRALEDPRRRAAVSAAVTIVAFSMVPVVHWSVVWWRSLHQEPSVLRMGGPTLPGPMLATLLITAIAASLLSGWMVMRRMRLARLQMRADNRLLRAHLAHVGSTLSPKELRG